MENEKRSIKNRENNVRRKLARQGFQLHKSRSNGFIYHNGVFQGRNMNNLGGYMIVDVSTNCIVAGPNYDLTLEDVEVFTGNSQRSIF